jgi:hypothetical protein
MSPDWKTKIAAYHSALNQHGYPSPPAPPSRMLVKRVLEDSDKKCQEYKTASGNKITHASENSVAFEIPSKCDELAGSFYIDFFVKQRL